MDIFIDIWTALFWLIRDIALIVTLEGVVKGFFAPRYKQKQYILAGWIIWLMAFSGVLVSLQSTNSEHSGLLFSTTNAVQFLLVDVILLSVAIPISRKIRLKKTTQRHVFHRGQG